MAKSKNGSFSVEMLPKVLPRLGMNQIENIKIHINELLAKKRANKRACALRILSGVRQLHSPLILLDCFDHVCLSLIV